MIPRFLRKVSSLVFCGLLDGYFGPKKLASQRSHGPRRWWLRRRQRSHQYPSAKETQHKPFAQLTHQATSIHFTDDFAFPIQERDPPRTPHTTPAKFANYRNLAASSSQCTLVQQTSDDILLVGEEKLHPVFHSTLARAISQTCATSQTFSIEELPSEIVFDAQTGFPSLKEIKAFGRYWGVFLGTKPGISLEKMYPGWVNRAGLLASGFEISIDVSCLPEGFWVITVDDLATVEIDNRIHYLGIELFDAALKPVPGSSVERIPLALQPRIKWMDKDQFLEFLADLYRLALVEGDSRCFI